MITPEEARRISEENPNRFVQRLIELTEKEIEMQAAKGLRKAMIAYTDNYYAHEAVEHFEQRGFAVRVISETLGGVKQHPAYFVCW